MAGPAGAARGVPGAVLARLARRAPARAGRSRHHPDHPPGRRSRGRAARRRRDGQGGCHLLEPRLRARSAGARCAARARGRRARARDLLLQGRRAVRGARDPHRSGRGILGVHALPAVIPEGASCFAAAAAGAPAEDRARAPRGGRKDSYAGLAGVRRRRARHPAGRARRPPPPRSVHRELARHLREDQGYPGASRRHVTALGAPERRHPLDPPGARSRPHAPHRRRDVRVRAHLARLLPG